MSIWFYAFWACFLIVLMGAMEVGEAIESAADDICRALKGSK